SPSASPRAHQPARPRGEIAETNPDAAGRWLIANDVCQVPSQPEPARFAFEIAWNEPSPRAHEQAAPRVWSQKCQNEATVIRIVAIMEDRRFPAKRLIISVVKRM